MITYLARVGKRFLLGSAAKEHPRYQLHGSMRVGRQSHYDPGTLAHYLDERTDEVKIRSDLDGWEAVQIGNSNGGTPLDIKEGEMVDNVHEKLSRFGDLAVSLEAELRSLYKEGRTSDALIAIAMAMGAAAARVAVERA